MNVTRPLSVTPRVCGFAMSWNSAPNRSASPRLSSCANGCASTARTASACSPRAAPGSRSSSITAGEHGERMVVDVEVVEAALLDAPQLREFWQHHVERAPGVEQRHALRRAFAPDDPHQLVEHPLGRDARETRRAGARGRGPSRDRPRTRARKRSARAASRAAGRARTPRPTPSAACGRAGPRGPPKGSTGTPPASGSAIALIVKSRCARSCSIVSPASGIRSSCQLRS